MDIITCKCGVTYEYQEFKKHFQKCQPFREAFKKFDSVFGSLLKDYSSEPQNLPIIKILLSQYIEVIERKIGKVNHIVPSIPPQIPNINNPGLQQQSNPFQPNPNFNMNNNSNPYDKIMNDKPQQFQNPFEQNQNIQNNQNNQNFQNINSNIDYIPPPSGFVNNNQNNYRDEDIMVCPKCNSPDVLYLECVHTICKSCFEKYAESDVINMKCLTCNSFISNEYKKMILGEDKYNKLEIAQNNIDIQGVVGGNIVECPGCNNKYPFEPGKNIDYKIKDDNNKIMSREACEHYSRNRVRCPTCSKNFCAQCKACPYHMGHTCESYKRLQEALKCRYDGVPINYSNRGPISDVCNNPECIERYRVSCKKTLPCGHHCFGTENDICPPCLDSKCDSFKNVFDQDMDSYCNICYTEGLGASPIVILSCNHYVHFICIRKRLQTKWVGPKITFNHCLCPVCNNWYDCTNPEINRLLIENKALYKNISEKALKRLEFEGLHKDDKLVNPSSKWYGKKLEYALNRLSYYMCYKCKQPYFAGRRECGDGPNQNNNNPDRPYNPEDCVCGKCSNLSGVAGVTNCKVHGKEYIEYKCRFCCKIASWFCWGTTHFCEDCHKRQCNGDYVSKYSKDKLPKCNPATCEIKVKHPPNGEEFALGCSICRNNEENARDF